MDRHDVPIEVSDLKGRLVVALVQKRVMELLGSEKFNSSFQIGMLAAFESFLETSKLKEAAPTEGEADEAQVEVFDDAGQTEDPLEREGLDVHALNRLAKDYREQLDAELPHRKMDALGKTLAERWTSGRKALVFVRRIGSVKELKAKLEVEYDAWLKARLQRRLPSEAMAALERWWEKYREERARTRRDAAGGPVGGPGAESPDTEA